MKLLMIVAIGTGLLSASTLVAQAQPGQGIEVNSVRVVDARQLEFANALERNRTDVVSDLLKRGVSPNIMIEDSDPALVRAIRLQNDQVIELLLAHPKTDVNMSSEYGETAIMLAAFAGDMDLVKRLLAKGATVRKANGWTALHYSATKGHLEITKLLIKAGADVNSRTSGGITPLFMAARDGHREVVMALLRAGAYRDLCNIKGESPSDAARKFGDQQLAKYLAVKRCVEPPSSPFSSIGQKPKP